MIIDLIIDNIHLYSHDLFITDKPIIIIALSPLPLIFDLPSCPAGELLCQDDIMSHWHCSVDEPVARQRQRQQKECERAQEGLSRVSSCFQQLVISLGSSADGNFLRDEIDEKRTLAHRLCIGTSTIRHSPVCLLPGGLSLVRLSVCRSVSAFGSPAIRL